jgi:hypothetical protein
LWKLAAFEGTARRPEGALGDDNRGAATRFLQVVIDTLGRLGQSMGSDAGDEEQTRAEGELVAVTPPRSRLRYPRWSTLEPVDTVNSGAMTGQHNLHSEQERLLRTNNGESAYPALQAHIDNLRRCLEEQQRAGPPAPLLDKED